MIEVLRLPAVYIRETVYHKSLADLSIFLPLCEGFAP